ncbi:hypothetical protein BLM14_24905 (plasmid) [Phyllobacterium zundukense]|nr:hypothetical protein BLM14_24905 [Phyllobacterium zundukense]
MTLVKYIREVFAGPDYHWLWFSPAISALQPIGHIAEDDRFAVCLAAINDNALRAAMAQERFPDRSALQLQDLGAH